MKWTCFYEQCMELGRATGCHQRPERSFFYRGKQFPVCARCTGVFIGELLGISFFKFAEVSIPVAICFCALMLLDWGIQFLFSRESNNIRRLITGLLCGYAFGDFIMKLIREGMRICNICF